MQKSLALVTGSSRGLGFHVAQGLVEKGWQVFGFARTLSSISAENYNHVPLDLGDLPIVETYFEGEFQRILQGQNYSQILLVNNAAQLGPVAGIRDINLRDLCDSFQLNTILPVWLMGFCLRQWPELPLTVINISSGAATKPYAGWAAYCSSKAALRMAGQVLIEDEAGKQPVRVLSYAPGVLDTRMQEEVRSSDPASFPQLERFQELYKKGQLIDPKLPAAELLRYIEKPFTAGEFQETRFGDLK